MMISEICTLKEASSQALIQNELKITNTSSQDITDLKLIIHAPHDTILEQSITRERGSLSFSPEITCLELGNLAPDESALFEYKFTPTDNLTSLSAHFTLMYTDLNNRQVTEKQLIDFLTDTPSLESPVPKPKNLDTETLDTETLDTEHLNPKPLETQPLNTSSSVKEL